ncbi:MAG TPA: phosphatidylglycerol lysyltransferase domain-containing protein [Candidatus Saccharimonadales bacterium]|nr:phosphatidylglycerol lysyltransferase domain-containing protein [Candidatus Saccharimonadales bacterium]
MKKFMEPSPKPAPSHRRFIPELISVAVVITGILFIAFSMFAALVLHGRDNGHAVLVGPPLIMGLTLLYVGMLLNKRKHTAWWVAVVIYGIWLVAYAIVAAFERPPDSGFDKLVTWVVNALAPGLTVIGLVLSRHEFRVKSDVRNFAIAVRFSILVLLIALVYGVVGFTLLDKRDFHQEINFGEAVHHTLDQFGLTNQQLVPHTRRARLFMQSLSVISVGAVGYAFVSLFQPLRARFGDHAANLRLAEELLKKYSAHSEDFFKLWPHDKLYFFDGLRRAGFAYAVRSGVALVVDGPFGEEDRYDALLDDFEELCRTNDWQIAFIHTEPSRNEWYKRRGFSLQKLGEEAVVDTATFKAEVRGAKYFRRTRNKFEEHGWRTELLTPPHSSETIARLTQISRDWLRKPGRAERRFIMGYFTPRYMQLCKLMVLRDEHGVIQGFINQIPSYDRSETTYDLLRHSRGSLPNSSDYLLSSFIEYADAEGYKRVSLGLSPLTGLGQNDESSTLISNALAFVYNRGDRFYSFSGLRNFKAKYKPVWSARYIVYRDGVPGFMRTVTALTRTMKVK